MQFKILDRIVAAGLDSPWIMTRNAIGAASVAFFLAAMLAVVARLHESVIVGAAAVIFMVLTAIMAVSYRWQSMKFLATERSDAEAIARIASHIPALNDQLVVSEFDVNGRFVAVNDNFEQLLGYRNAAIVGEYGSILHDDGSDGAKFFKVQAALARGKMHSSKQKLITNCGKIVTVACTHLPKFDANGKRIGALTICTDITERTVQERQQVHSVANVSHELRAPLTSIKGSLRLLTSGVLGELNDDSCKLVSIADRNTDRMLNVLDDILDFEKVVAKKMEFDMSPVNVSDLIEQAIELNQGYAEEYGVRFAAGRQYPEAWIWGDRTRLMQVLTNLMSNAAKYSPYACDVNVKVCDTGGAWRISVADKGPGIPEDSRGKVFASFSQIDPADGIGRKGTGLGLAISERIIDAHSGTIDFKSVVGEGATFYFELAKLYCADRPIDSAASTAPQMVPSFSSEGAA